MPVRESERDIFCLLLEAPLSSEPSFILLLHMAYVILCILNRYFAKPPVDDTKPERGMILIRETTKVYLMLFTSFMKYSQFQT